MNKCQYCNRSIERKLVGVHWVHQIGQEQFECAYITLDVPASQPETKHASAFSEFDKAVKYLRSNGYGDWDGTANGQEITLTGCANMMRQYLRDAPLTPSPASPSAIVEEWCDKWGFNYTLPMLEELEAAVVLAAAKPADLQLSAEQLNDAMNGYDSGTTTRTTVLIRLNNILSGTQ